MKFLLDQGWTTVRDAGGPANGIKKAIDEGNTRYGPSAGLADFRAAAADNESVYADIVQQDLPATSNIVSFCQRFIRRIRLASSFLP